MNLKGWFKEAGRWVLAICIAAVVFMAGLYVGVIAMFCGGGAIVGEQVVSFLPVTLAIVAGSLIAPRRRRFIAVAGFSILASLAARLPGLEVGGICLAVVLSATFVLFWTSPRRTPQGQRHLMSALGVFVAVFLVYAWCRRIDWPELPQKVSDEIRFAMRDTALDRGAFREYDLGGFIDHEWLWRLDGGSDVVARVVAAYRLQLATNVPPDFWDMPPYYWPRKLPPLAQIYQSAGFPQSGRGRDGSHYFMLFDPERSRAFVWYKNNF